MRAKISKTLKKLAVGLLSTAGIFFCVILFATPQEPILEFTKNGADAVENFFYDLYFKTITLRSLDSNYTDNKVSITKNYDPNIFIVDIDEPSLTKLGNYNEWDRSIHANVIKNLSAGGAAAIGLDILFKNADFGQQKATQVVNLLKDMYPNVDWNNAQIQARLNFDSLLVKAAKESDNTIACFMFDDSTSYKHESQWRPLSTIDRADNLGYTSTFQESQISSSIKEIEAKDLLDNIFPELAKAAKHIGAVNAYPDNDGVVRRIALLYRFPNTAPYENVPTHIYSTMSLMTILHLFHQDIKNVKVELGKYIDVGRPFGIYRDSLGKVHTTYPGFTNPMFKSLLRKLHSIDLNNPPKEGFIDISSKIIATKDSDDNVLFEIFEGQVLDAHLSKTLQKLTPAMLSNLKMDETRYLGGKVSLRHEEGNENRFVLYDEIEDEEYYINSYIVETIQYFEDSLSRLAKNVPTHLSLDLDIHYNKDRNLWESSNVILSDSVIRDIAKIPEAAIKALRPNEELRFGPIKKIPIDNHGKFLVNYKGRYNTTEINRTFQHLSYYDVTTNRLDPALYQGKIFILGSAAQAMFDFISCPHEEHYPGVLVHASIIRDILSDDYMTVLNEQVQRVIILILAVLCMLIGLYFRSYLSISISVLLALAYVIVAYFYFTKGIYLGVSRQVITILFTNITSLIVQFYYEAREKRFLDNAFKQYISPELIDEMVNNEIMPTLGGDKSNITAFFTDIASFSTFSEQIGDPSRLVKLLNDYLTEMTDTLLENKGTLDKYEGDAIIAFFGAPMPLENHAQKACETAVAMQEKLLELRERWKHEGTKWPAIVHNMHMRIGINSGDIVTGNMGSSKRMNYTMMGDAVNLASRLESAAKQYGAYIQISEDTKNQLTEDTFIIRSLDNIRVIGKSKPVKTYELLGKVGCADEKRLKRLVYSWEQARQCYLDMQWDNAIELFTECLEFEPHDPERDPGSNTTPSHVYIERCMEYKKVPPVTEGETWDGVFTATEK